MSGVVEELLMSRPRTLLLLASFALAFLLTGCTEVALGSNFTLAEGQRITGSLIVPSANVTLEEGSEVTGSVVVLCCNLDVGGQVGGDILLLTGNLSLDPGAEIGGDVSVLSGNLAFSPGVLPEGRISSSLSLGIILKYGVLPVLACVALPLLLVYLILYVILRRRRKAHFA